MVLNQLYSCLEHESEPINHALSEAIADLPASVRPVAAHILEAGGKRLRPVLTVLTARMLGYAGSGLYVLAASLECLHAATLLHDDILDEAATRRGKPAAHTIFGIKSTILAGDSLLALGNAIVASFNIPALCLCYSNATIQTAAGEVLEMSALRLPGLTADQYLEIARGKTACLIAQACLMGATIADAPPKLAEACAIYGENLGLAFQLVDDALDFAPEIITGKPSGGDLREGKMTPPLRLYRASLDEAGRGEFDAHFVRGDFTDSQIKSIVRDVGPFAQASLNLADECLKEAAFALAQLPSGEERQLLEQMTHYVRNRQR